MPRAKTYLEYPADSAPSITVEIFDRRVVSVRDASGSIAQRKISKGTAQSRSRPRRNSKT
jgi:hypothetical protein